MEASDEAYINVDMFNFMLGRSDKVVPVVMFCLPSNSDKFLRLGTVPAARAMELPEDAYKRAKAILPSCGVLKDGCIILASGTDKMCLLQLRSPPETSIAGPDIIFPPMVSA